MRLAERYAEVARETLERVAQTQLGAIRRAGEAVARALANGGVFWLYRLGHGGEQDLLHRAGGLVAARPFGFSLEVSSRPPKARRGRPGGECVEADLEAVRLAVRASEMRGGDVLLLSSVSGRNRVPVELAREARRLGVTVVGVTSREYTAQVESAHPSGEKLCDVADIVIDNCAPFGDACIEVEGYEHKALPISGLAHLLIAWMICGEAIERMAAMGKRPHVYQSVNRPGGGEYNERAERECDRLGY